MAVTLTSVWVHDAGNPADYLLLDANSEVETTVVDGERRRRANGRLVSVTKPGTETDVSFTVPVMSRTDYQDLQARVGDRVMVRDTHGRVLFGVLYGLSAADWLKSSAQVVDVQFTLVTSGSQEPEV